MRGRGLIDSNRTLGATLLLALVARVALAEVRVEVTSGIPDALGIVTVGVVLRTEGEAVGGFQNDIVFDHTIARLDSCRIAPAIGTMASGASGDVSCADDPGIGPCKTLSQAVVRCAGDPLPAGCPPQAPSYSRLRAIVAGTEVFNQVPIPADTVVYTCNFTVADAAGLPVRLFNTNVVVSDPRGRRLDASGSDGGICVGGQGGQRCASLGATGAECTIDLECESGHCDRCCEFAGTCAPPRTPTPTDSPTATRTPAATRTPTGTRSATPTPLPGGPGQACQADEHCVQGVCLDGVCCRSRLCPGGQRCDVPGYAGDCHDPLAPPGSGEDSTTGVQPTASATPDLFRFVQDEGCSLEPGGMGVGFPWPLAAAVVVAIWRRASGRKRGA